jgi:hypothetical protein
MARKFIIMSKKEYEKGFIPAFVKTVDDKPLTNAQLEALWEDKTGHKTSNKAVCRGKAASKGVKASKLASKPRKGKK